MKTFAEAVQEFIDGNSGWLGADHIIAVTTLIHTANELDGQVASGKINPPLLTAFGLAFRNLLKERPMDGEEDDEVTTLLKSLKDN
jgi:hypothetical protein